MGGISAERLLKELDANWRLLGKAESNGVLRACSMTLITIARAHEDAQALGATLAALTREYPNRSIVLRVREGRGVEARAAIQCWMPFGMRQQICAEHIEFVAGADTLEEVIPVLLGLMTPDLPRVVWCRDGTLAAAAGIRQVLKMAPNTVVDSGAEAVVKLLQGDLRP